jgi:nicotinate-nucleotide pyrophosphorylase (carboxylating)
MSKEFAQIEWDASLENDLRHLIRLAIREDLDRGYDWTTVALVPHDAQAKAIVIARRAGTIAGLPAVPFLCQEMETALRFTPLATDGQRVQAGMRVGELSGAARDLLTAERLLLNLLGRLSGVATLTRSYVDAIAHRGARIYDTRKTTPGWRRLEKYAVRCGGGINHRVGLFAAVMIKDNHVAWATDAGVSLEGAVDRVREFLRATLAGDAAEQMIIEVEVDTVQQFRRVLTTRPDIVLLDNMDLSSLRQCVAERDAVAPGVELEVAGGVSLETVREIAETGVERISVGALTHSAPSLDLGLDWCD